MADNFRDKLNDIINRKLHRSSEKIDNEIMNETLPFILETVRETFRQDMREELVNKESLLMKRLEDHSLYQAGKLTNENEYLKAEKEILLQELDKYKNLQEELKEKEIEIKSLGKLLEEERKLREITDNKNREICLELELQKKSELWKEHEECKLKERKKPWWKKIFT
jgi:hypothetical protein